MELRGPNGGRPRLLIVGGNGSTPARFARVWPHLEERFRTTLVEVAGQGSRAQSFVAAGRNSRIERRDPDGPPRILPATFDGIVDDLAAELEQAAAGEPALCYGQGIGGLLLAHALRRAPEAAARLVLHAPVGAHLARRRFPLLMAWAPLRGLVRRALASPILGPQLARRLFEPGGAVTRQDRQAFAAGYRQARSFGLLFAATDPLAALDDLEQLTLPITLLWGGRDGVLHPEQLPAWAEALRKAPVTARLVPHWRHYPYLDRPQEFAAVLAECAADRLPEEPVSLDELTHFRPRTKAGRLASMRRAGLPVPGGWWVPARALENGSAARLFCSLPVHARYAVRSSALREDQADETAAGIYDSELEVPPAELLAACRRVSRSGRAEYLSGVQAFGRSGVQKEHDPERLNARTPERLDCDVLVQPMAPRAAGGVTWVRALAVDLELAGGAFDRAVAGAARVTRAALSTLGPPWTEVPEDLPVGLSERRLRTGLWPHLRQAHALFDTGTLDMEWAYDGQGAFVLLQARPVGERHPARRLLTAANLREVTPPEPSPFLLGALEAVSLRLPRYYARLDRRVAAWREPFSVTVGSRAYINVDLYAALMDRWGLPRALVSRAIGGSVPGRPPRPDRLLASLPALARLAADWTRLHPGGVATLARLRSELEAAREPPELAAWFVDAFESLIQGMFGIASALSAAIPLWPGPAPAVATAAMAAELRSASDVGSAAAWTAFAEHWGHRGEYESDPAWPRGDEMLERVISEGVIEVNRQNHPLTHHPLPGYPRLHPRTPAPRPPLPDPLTALPRPLRRFPMLAPRHLRAHREWFKDGAMRLWAAFRARMLAAAAEQVRRGALEQPEQIWMLTPDEIQRLSPAQWRAAAGRRADARPDSVGADLFWSDTLSPLARAPGSRYTRRDDRLPLVTGMVSGPALVAHTPSEALALLATLPTSGALGADPGPRPILLAPAVDPGWLPVFLRVAGVATELGGRLSHAATLLRELRIPSVLNLSGVTQTARSGEPIVLRVPPGEVSRTPGA